MWTAGRDLISPRSTCTVEIRLAGVPVGGDLGSELERLERRLGPLHYGLLIDGVLLPATIPEAESASKGSAAPFVGRSRLAARSNCGARNPCRGSAGAPG